MAATVVTTLTFPKSDTVNNKVNSSILKQELDDARLSILVESVSLVGTSVKIGLTGTATTDDETKITAVISAHAGEDFASVPQVAADEALVSDDTGTVIQKLQLSTGALPAGTYLISWYMEIAITSETTGSYACGTLTVQTNSGVGVERAQHNNTEVAWKAMSGAISVTAVAGDDYVVALHYARTGLTGNAARAQRARINVVRIG